MTRRRTLSKAVVIIAGALGLSALPLICADYYATTGTAGSAVDILAEEKPAGVTHGTAAKGVSVANNGTVTLLNVTNQSGYVSFIGLEVAPGDINSTLTITADGNTVFNDRAVLFFGAEYVSTVSGFNSRFIAATNDGSTGEGMRSYIPIPFGSSVSIVYKNTSGAAETVWYNVYYQTRVADSWPLTRHLHTCSGTVATAAPQSVITMCNASGLSPGRLLGVAFNIDSYPGSASPATAPLEGEFKVYLDGAATPTIQSTGTEDYLGSGFYFGNWPSPGLNSFSTANSAYVGLTERTSETWGGYRFHIMDPVTFQNALKFTWDVGESVVSFTGTVRFSYCVWYYTQ